MASKLAAVFKANDGSEHETAKAAHKHNRLLAASDELRIAQEKFNRALGETGMTADGQHFEMNCIRDYWYVTQGWDGLPQVLSLYSWPPHLHVTRDNGDVNLVLYDYGGAKEPRRYPINELYADRRKADAARIEIAKKRLQEFADQVGALSAATQ